MKSHRVLWIVGAAIAVAFLLGQTGWSTADAQVIQMRVALHIDEKHPVYLGAKQMAAKVEERTKGQVKMTLFPNNALGSPPEMLEQVVLGTLDMSLNTQGQLENHIKASATPQIPFIFDDYEHAHRTMDGPAMQWFIPQFERAGLIYLANWEWGFRNLTNNKRAILKPEDVKGLKVRVPPEFHLQALFESLGAVVTQIAWPEVYMALAQNVVDGQENPLNAIYYAKFYEVQKHVALTRHAYSCLIPVVSTKTWAKLNPEQQQIMREEAKRSGDWVRKALNDEETDLIAKFEKAGLQVTQPDLKPFRAAMASANEKIYKRYGEENVKTFLKFVEDARKK
ncbi:MAG TPA: TRAP transporter substrate-binding protein [Candidatus Methylomirabilis sp.]|nr:TRAP transporter substrate-binding protein [Candidatus Methylomirabilis sp.]